MCKYANGLSPDGEIQTEFRGTESKIEQFEIRNYFRRCPFQRTRYALGPEPYVASPRPRACSRTCLGLWAFHCRP